MKVIACINQKGGSGKSTITRNLAVALVGRGLRVTIIDTDQQRTTINWYANRQQFKHNESDLLAVIYPTLSELQHKLDGVKDASDIVIIDGTPSVNEMSSFAALNADLILTPLNPTADDLDSTVSFIQELPEGINPLILFNRCPARPTKHSTAIIDAMSGTGLEICKVQIKARTSYTECFSSGAGVVELKDKKAIEEIKNLCDEVMERISCEVTV